MKAIYIRTSTKEQTPENQLRDLSEIVDTRDIKIYIDKQSAWTDYKERKEFEHLKKEIIKGNIKEIYVWDLDRIYRNRKKLIEFFQFTKIYGCKIYSYRQQWLESLNKIQPPFNEIMFDLMIQIMGWLAEEESNKKSERVKLAVRRSPEGVTRSYKGKKWGRKPISPQKKKKVLELAKNGLSMRKIAKEVNLSVGTIHNVLKNQDG